MARRSVVFLALAGVFCASAQTPPPARPQFEVASVKPTAANADPLRAMAPRLALMRSLVHQNGIIPGDKGRVHIEHWPLLDLIAAAYRVRTTEISGPTWLGDQYFDIDAKIPTGTPADQRNEMLQMLLEERFGLKLHRESKVESGFALVVGKNGPKLKASAPPPESRKDLSPEEQKALAREQAEGAMKLMQASMKKGPQRPGSRASWTGITAGDLANRLARLAEGPVVDLTGLTGKYDVLVEMWQGDEPGGTIFDAVERLGLKLEPRKLTVALLVIDRASKTPTAN
jgi:uncharacterized protein (TIGR03435 family)